MDPLRNASVLRTFPEGTVSPTAMPWANDPRNRPPNLHVAFNLASRQLSFVARVTWRQPVAHTFRGPCKRIRPTGPLLPQFVLIHFPPTLPPIFLGVLLRSVPEIRHKKESKKRIDWWHVIHAFLFPSPIIPGNVSLKRLGARSRRMDKVRHWSEEKKRQAKLECSSVTSANYVRPFPIHGDRYTGFIMRLG